MHRESRPFPTRRSSDLFKCAGRGEPCGETELSQMTELLRRIRAMTEAVGRKKGAPILLAVRVPDSVPYCKLIGLDLDRKSTRLNSSHLGISYAVFCLKK